MANPVALEFDLIGYTSLRRQLEAMEPKVAQRIERKAMRPAMKLVQTEAKARAPKKSGLLRRSIKVRAMKRSRYRQGVEVRLGPEGFYKGKTFYGAFVEFGHAIGKRTSAIRRGRQADLRRHVPGVHFMQGAYLSRCDEARNLALTLMLHQIEGTWNGGKL